MIFPLFLLGFVPWASSFILPIKLAAVVNQTEQAEVLTEHKYIWTTTVIIGTPGKAFTVQIDTSSSMLWILDVTSNSTTHPTFDSSQSSTYIHFTNMTFGLDTFGSTTRGLIGMDTVILGESFNSNPSRTSITVPNATFGQGQTIPWDMPDFVDGVLGLCLPYKSPTDSQPVFQTAINQGDVTKGIFAIWLEDQGESSDNGTQGVIYYGNNDNLHCQPNPNMYPLFAAWDWMFQIPSLKSEVPNKSPYNFNKKITAYLDTTSPYIELPIVPFDKIMTELKIKRNQQFPTTVPCDLKITLSFNMPYGVEQVTEQNLVIKKPDGTCQLQLVNTMWDKSGDGQNYYLLGTPFFRGRCTYFDQARQMFGFSQPLTHTKH